jgi:hypothetical protein
VSAGQAVAVGPEGLVSGTNSKCMPAGDGLWFVPPKVIKHRGNGVLLTKAEQLPGLPLELGQEAVPLRACTWGLAVSQASGASGAAGSSRGTPGASSSRVVPPAAAAAASPAVAGGGPAQDEQLRGAAHAAVPGSWQQLSSFEATVSRDAEGLWLRWARGYNPHLDSLGRLLRAQLVRGSCWVGDSVLKRLLVPGLAPGCLHDTAAGAGGKTGKTPMLSSCSRHAQ